MKGLGGNTERLTTAVLMIFSILLQNASADVEKMILGNKCDLQESRVVDQERGRVVSEFWSCDRFGHRSVVSLDHVIVMWGDM